MALKDLKSDLSKFRRPVEKPLVEQKRVEVPKSTNQTPLSQFVDSTPAAPKSNLTTPKQGVTPNKFDNSSNFLGETTPNKFDNTSNYLGETTPTKMSLKERFLGQTEPKVVEQGDKFKGETETKDITQGDRYKGETTPQGYSNAEKFKGETTPNEFKFVKQFLGETNPTKSNLSAQFLGETNTTNITQGDKFKGETDPTLITYDPNLEKQGKDPKFVDFFSNEDAWGFSPLQKHKSPSKFRGVDPTQTNFDGTTSLYGLNTPKKYNEQSKVTKLNSKFDFTTAVNYNVTRDLDNGLKKSYTNKVLKKEYNRFNLKEDSPNNWFIKHPLILTGIQTKKGEPFNYGIGGLSFIRGGAVTSTTRAAFDTARIAQMILTPRGLIWGLKQIGMQRTNTYGKAWTPINLLANVLSQHIGLRWDRPGIIPIGDESWKYGFKMRVIKVAEKTSKIAGLLAQKSTEVEGISYLYNNKLKLGVGRTLKEQKGGPDSFYGIGKTFTTQYVDTFQNDGKDWGDSQAGRAVDVGGGWSSWKAFEQKYDPFKKNFKTYTESLPDDNEGNLSYQTEENSPIPIDTKFKQRGLYESDGLIKGQADIADYEAISYAKIAKRANDPMTTNPTDFRELYPGTLKDPLSGQGGKYGYKKAGIGSRYKLSSPLPGTQKTFANMFGASSVLHRDSGDEINKQVYSSDIKSDFVTLYFRKNSPTAQILQFRSTVSGITETFSPSWNGVKYPGRADKTYMYEEFERTLSFNFKVYAESRGDMQNMWNKLDELSRMAYPIHSSNTYTGYLVYFRLGDLYNNVASFITSLSYTIPDDLPWDTNQDGALGELPMGADVNISLTLLPNGSVYNGSSKEYSFK